jgi:hypothetical protein
MHGVLIGVTLIESILLRTGEVLPYLTIVIESLAGGDLGQATVSGAELQSNMSGPSDSDGKLDPMKTRYLTLDPHTLHLQTLKLSRRVWLTKMAATTSAFLSL